jgi:hypothetical protein
MAYVYAFGLLLVALSGTREVVRLWRGNPRALFVRQSEPWSAWPYGRWGWTIYALDDLRPRVVSLQDVPTLRFGLIVG